MQPTEIAEIEKEISHFVTSSKDIDISLMTHHTGIALFYAYLFVHTQKQEHLDKAIEVLSGCIHSLNTTNVDFTLANGVTGLAWTIEHLTRLDIIDFSSLEGRPVLQELISKSIANDLKQRNYDLLYGAIGKGIYFLEVPGSAYSKVSLEKIVLGIRSMSVFDNDGLTWLSHRRQKDNSIKECSELGLAHGVASIIAFLSRVNRSGVLPSETLTLLRQSVNWLMEQKDISSRFTFPITKPQDSRPPWLAWCTGDLGMALAIYHAGITLDDQSLVIDSIEIVDKACNINVLDSGIHLDMTRNLHDAGLCHGSLGLAYIFHKFYTVTDELKFKKKCEYWCKCALDFWSVKTHGVQRISRFNGSNQKNKWIRDYGVLEGLAGIGLALLSLNGAQNLEWEKLFFLDID